VTAVTALRTPLYERHLEMGAQMVEFGGWLMPLQYSSIRDEHIAVRERVGLFDVSHMGEFRLEGSGALEALEGIVSNEVASLSIGQARYNIVCNESGGIIDDALVYRDAEERFTVVVNAGPRNGDLQHFREVAGSVEVRDVTLGTALLAAQGPRAIAALQPLADIDLAQVGYYHFRPGRLAGTDCVYSRTGYTGEDGFEVFVPSDHAVEAWDTILVAGDEAGIIPCGLGARDTLRLEAAMRLSGQDVDGSTNPLEAGLGWAVKLEKGDFCGRDALRQIKQDGPARAFIGLELEGRAIARHGHQILDHAEVVGEVTSGTFSFTLGRAVAMGYVAASSKDSDRLTVSIRDEPVSARRVPLPFYKRLRS
jgi:aminomethyltransferase